MGRRRRQKNPLLNRIIAVSVGAHIVALPVLAHFNTFKSIQKSFQQVQMVVLAPPPDTEPPKPVEEKKSATKSAVKKSGGANQHHGPIKIAQNAPHVAVASGAGGEDGGDGGDVVQGAVKQGNLPPEGDKGGAGNKTETPVAPPVTKPPSPIETKPTPMPVEVKPTPVPKPTPKPVEPTPVVVSKAPVYTEATPIGEQPTPDIPDDLRSEALDKMAVVECVVSLEGTTKEAKVVQSSGNNELDRRAVQVARRWKFKPATKDGQPVESRVRLHIEFQVSE